MSLPQVDDIFSETDNSNQPVQPPITAQPQVAASSVGDDTVGVGRSSRGVVWKIIGLALIIALVILGAVAYWNNWRQVVVPPVQLNNQENEQVNNQNIVSDVTPDDTVIDTTTTTLTADADGDGLSDDLERQLNTDSNNPDTDADGLFDGAEVNIYQTDPLNSDTDGDGYVDGEEVMHGYDPKKVGAKLFDLAQ